MRTARSKNAKNSTGSSKFSHYLRHHRYAIGNVLSSLWQSRWTVIINSIILGLSLALPLALASIAFHFDVFSDSLNPPVTLYLQPGDTASQVPTDTVLASLNEDPRVATLSLISREDILERVLQQLDIEHSSSLDAINPFADTISMTLVPGTRSAEGLDDFINELQASYGFGDVDIAKVSPVSRWHDLLALFHRFAFALSVIVLLSTILLCGYMVRNQILRQHLEIEVTRYCGANKAFIRRPFLYWGAAQGCLGAVCAWTIVYACFAFLVPSMNALSGFGNVENLQALFYLTELLGTLVAGSLLGFLGAWIATRLHLSAATHTEIR